MFNKLFVMVLFLLMLPAMAIAGPFLVCDPPDPTEQIDQYVIFKDGVEYAQADPDPSGTHGFKLDLSGLTPGKYVFTAKAKNVWGESEISNPYESAPSAGKPGPLKLIPE